MSAFDVQQKEEFFPNGGLALQKGDYCKLVLPPSLKFRKIYCFTELLVSPQSGYYTLSAEVIMYREGRLLGKLPADIQYDGNQVAAQSQFSLFANSNNGQPDAGLLTMAKPLNFSSMVLNPTHLTVEADSMLLSVTGLQGLGGASIIGARLFLACLSSLEAFS